VIVAVGGGDHLPVGIDAMPCDFSGFKRILNLREKANGVCEEDDDNTEPPTDAKRSIRASLDPFSVPHFTPFRVNCQILKNYLILTIVFVASLRFIKHRF